MGEVWRARGMHLGRDVAIKLLLEGVSADPDRLARFEREARVLAALNHPNVATLFGFERDDSGSTPFLVMELVEGETLAERIDRGPVPFSEAHRIFIQIAEGLEAAHEQGIVHRDLKPANLKLSSDAQGGPLRVKVLDFGLAKPLDSGEGRSPDLSQTPTLTAAATRRGEVMGTAAYMSPEQARGETIESVPTSGLSAPASSRRWPGRRLSRARPRRTRWSRFSITSLTGTRCPRRRPPKCSVCCAAA